MKTIRPNTEQAIIEAAFMQLNKNPKASLADIAQLAGVGRATLHRHFSGRDELISVMAKLAIEETETAANLASQSSTSYSAALEHIFKAMIPLGSRHWFLSQEHISADEKIKRKLKKQDQDMTKLINKAKNEGLFKHHPTAWITQAYDHMIHAAWTLIKTEQATTQQVTDWAWSTLVGGLQNPGSAT